MPALVFLIILMAIAGAGLVVSGVYISIGLGSAMICAGILLMAAAITTRLGLGNG